MSEAKKDSSRRFDAASYAVAGAVFLIACLVSWIAIARSPELGDALKNAVHETASQLGLVKEPEPEAKVAAKPAPKPSEKPAKTRTRTKPGMEEAPAAPAAPEIHPPIEAEAVVQNQRVALQPKDNHIVVVQTH